MPHRLPVASMKSLSSLPSLSSHNIRPSMTMVQVNDSFQTIVAAKEAISHFLLNTGSSYKAYKTDSTQYILIYKDTDCSFKIRASYSKKLSRAVITILEPHVCSPVIHSYNRASSGVAYLMSHHMAFVTGLCNRQPHYHTSPAPVK
jgi:hypothetical protein